jgi:hypothetical protein
MKGYAVSGIPYAIREIKRFRVKSISNPDERISAFCSSFSCKKKQENEAVRHYQTSMSEPMLFCLLNQDVIFL